MKHRIGHRNLPQRLLAVRERLMGHFRPLLNHFGLTEQQWRILRVLDERETAEPRELCEACQILSSNMPGVLDRLAAMGCVQRRRDPGDLRRVLVSLAPHGERLVEEMAPYIEQQYRNLEAVYTKKALATLEKALEDFLGIDDAQIKRVDPALDGATPATPPRPAPRLKGVQPGRPSMRGRARIGT